MKHVTLVTKPTCPYCIHAKQLLDSLGVAYTDIDATKEPDVREAWRKKYQHDTVPMIVVGDQFIGGSSDLDRLHQSGALKKMLEA